MSNKALAAKLRWPEYRTSVSRLLSSYIMDMKLPHLWHCFSKYNHTELKSTRKQWNTQKYLFMISVHSRSSPWSVSQQTPSFFREQIAKGDWCIHIFKGIGGVAASFKYNPCYFIIRKIKQQPDDLCLLGKLWTRCIASTVNTHRSYYLKQKVHEKLEHKTKSWTSPWSCHLWAPQI